MALPASTVHEVQTGGSDTLNGGCFDPNNAGMNGSFSIASANTSASVVSHGSYNFAAGDVGNWFYLKSGTSSIPGWYKIASVAANQATLNATIGAGVLANGTPTTATGCGTTGSLTSQTGTIDYSQQGGVQFSLTGLTTAAANAIILTTAATIVMAGNGIQITGGTNFTTGVYVIATVSAGVSLTVDRTCTSAAGVAGTAGLGGAFASPGFASGKMTASNDLFIKTGSYSITSASTNIAGGCLNPAGSGSNADQTRIIGYSSVRGDNAAQATLLASGISTFTLVNLSGTAWVENIIADGASLTSSRGFSGSSSIAYKCTAQNCTNAGFSFGANCIGILCYATGCSTTAAYNTGTFYGCVAVANTITGFVLSNTTTGCVDCISYNNTGASTDGFNLQIGGYALNCVSYNNGRHGFFTTATTVGQFINNSLAAGNAGYGFSASAATQSVFLQNCAAYNNTSGTFNSAVVTGFVRGFVTLSSDPFVNAVSGNFALNNTAGAGAACRAAGIPGVYPGGLTTGYLDIGAVQHADAGGGIIQSGLNGGLS